MSIHCILLEMRELHSYKFLSRAIGCYAKKVSSWTLVITIFIIFVLSVNVPATAQVVTNYVADAAKNHEVKTFTSSSNRHGNIGAVASAGAHSYDYVGIKMTITDDSADYTFGQTSNSGNIDTVMIVYDEVFDPLNPGLNKLAFNDDGDISPAGACSNAGFCPVVKADLTGKRDIILVISTYNAGIGTLSIPQSFYASGPAAVSFSAAGSPNEPTSLSATPGDTQVAIAFTPPTSDGGKPISNYEYTTDDGTSWTAFAPADTASPVTVTGLTNGTPYTFKLRAVNSVGGGTPSANVVATPTGLPNAPTGLSAAPRDSQVSVAFTPPSDNGGTAITNYQYSTDGLTWTAFAPADTASPVTVTGLTNGTPYDIQLKAVNAGGAGAESTIVTSTPVTTPNAPTNLSATPGSDEASITFTLPSSNGGSTITNYEYTLNGGTNWTAFAPATTTNSVKITGLTNGTTHTIGLRAVNVVGPGTASANVTVTPIPNPTPPSAPTDLSATPEDTQISVAFNAPTNDGGAAITNYEYTFDNGINWTEFSPAVANGPATITGLINSNIYTIHLRAVNSVGPGAKSVTSVTATPTNGLSPPTAPTSLSATPGGKEIIVKFTDPISDGGSVITNYQYTTDGGTSWTAFNPNDTSSPVTIAGLANGTTYTVGLRAVNAVGPGTKSQTVVTATPLATPDAPTTFTAAAKINASAGDGKVVVNFTPAPDPTGAPITNYQYSIDGGWSWVAFNPAITSSPATISGLENGVEYSIELRAINAVGPGAVSQTAKATPIATPNAPTNLSAVTSATQVNLNFTPPSDLGGSAVTNYEYTFDDGATWIAFNPAITSSPATFTGLTLETTYITKLRAINAAGSGTPSQAITFNYGTPRSAFDKRKTEILNMVVGNETRNLRTLMYSNQKLMQGARARFIHYNKKDHANSVGENTELTAKSTPSNQSSKKIKQLAFISTDNGVSKNCGRLSSCGVIDFDIAGSAQFSKGVLSSSGEFINQTGSKKGKERRLILGDFDVHHDSKSGSTVSTINGKLLWENTLNTKTMFGSFLGIGQAHGDLKGTFAGNQKSWRTSLGGYVIHELSSGLYADAMISFYRGNQFIDVADDILDLNSDYSTWAATYKASLSGMIENWGLEIWPEFTLSHGRNSIGNIIFTGNAYSLIDNELDLNAGSIEITKLMLRPEARVPADLLGIADKMTLFTFSPKLMCEEIVANSPIQYTQERNCGRGAEYGLARRSEDGLTEFTGKVVIDTVGVNTRTSINVNLGYQF